MIQECLVFGYQVRSSFLHSTWTGPPCVDPSRICGISLCCAKFISKMGKVKLKLSARAYWHTIFKGCTLQYWASTYQGCALLCKFSLLALVQRPTDSFILLIVLLITCAGTSQCMWNLFPTWGAEGTCSTLQQLFGGWNLLLSMALASIAICSYV
jgi:hypothetical protein